MRLPPSCSAWECCCWSPRMRCQGSPSRPVRSCRWADLLRQLRDHAVLVVPLLGALVPVDHAPDPEQWGSQESNEYQHEGERNEVPDEDADALGGLTVHQGPEAGKDPTVTQRKSPYL